MALLRLAIMLHDIGKGTGREHSRASERDCRRNRGSASGMPEHEMEVVRQLVALHLELSSIMNSRDIDDGRNRAVCSRDSVGTVEQLRLLALLTYADISGVNPTAMTPWRSDQLWRSYLSGL